MKNDFVLSLEGIGLVSAAGNGLDEFSKSKIIKRILPAPYDDYGTVFKCEVKGLDEFINGAALRRMDRFSRMAVLSAFLAKKDSGIEFQGHAETGIIFASAHGAAAASFRFLDSIINDGDKCASPSQFAFSVHNSPASQVSTLLDIRGPVQSISAFDNLMPNLMNTAYDWLKSGLVEYVIAGIGDEYSVPGAYAASEISASANCAYRYSEGFAVFVLSLRNEPKYANIELYHLNAGAGELVSLLRESGINRCILAGNGLESHENCFKGLDFSGFDVSEYSEIFGDSSISPAFAIAAAAFSGKFPALLVEAAGKRKFNLYKIGKNK